MSYHYVFSTRTGEERRIVSASLDSYLAAGHWKIFDTEEARAAAQGPTWYVINYPMLRAPSKVMPGMAGTYWTAEKMIAGWACFTDSEEARKALHAMPRRFAIDPNSGEVRVIKTWLSVDQRTPLPETFVQGGWSSIEQAQAAYPASLFCLHPEGYEDKCYPAQRPHMEREGYIVGASLEDCRARLPIRWAYATSKRAYIRTSTGRILTRPSAFANLRRALLALGAGQPTFRHASREGNAYSTMDTIGAALHMVATIHSTAYEDYHVPNRTEIADFMARVNAIVPNAMAMCSDCESAYTTTFDRTINGRRICSGCAGQYMTCATCNNLFREEDTREGQRGEVYCVAHWIAPRNTNISGELMAYSTDVTRRLPIFLKGLGEVVSPRTLWLGWELEVHPRQTGDSETTGHDPNCDDCGGSGSYTDGDGDEMDCDCEGRSYGITEAVKRIAAAAGSWAICKSDSSLDDGLEIVSVPASLAWHSGHVPPFLQDAKEYISGWPHNDCGIHVHVGRKEISDLTLGKILCFMHHPYNQDFVTAIAGRSPNTYCTRGAVKKITEGRHEASLGRYQAVNLSTKNKKTIEFRIFRSNVSPAGFMKNLEFTHAVCTWARDAAPANEKLLRVPAFVEWVTANRSGYPFLVRFLESNGTLPKPKAHIDYVPSSIVLAA